MQVSFSNTFTFTATSSRIALDSSHWTVLTDRLHPISSLCQGCWNTASEGKMMLFAGRRIHYCDYGFYEAGMYYYRRYFNEISRPCGSSLLHCGLAVYCISCLQHVRVPQIYLGTQYSAAEQPIISQVFLAAISPQTLPLEALETTRETRTRQSPTYIPLIINALHSTRCHRSIRANQKATLFSRSTTG